MAACSAVSAARQAGHRQSVSGSIRAAGRCGRSLHQQLGRSRPQPNERAQREHDFAIAPGDPDRSFLIYRLESTDPGIAMPEVGRSTVHREGAALLRQWIAEMPKASH